jgi:tRNA(Leu) C34 or U34 (ribose-2'-O)-methylase TrmL
VGAVIRLASCFDFKQVWYTGNRIQLEEGERLPREERMKGYDNVDFINYDKPFDMFENVTPVAVEVQKNSENLFEFEHPPNPMYVFGPEDGSIPSVLRRHCHRFLYIPSNHCLNLATAISAILWDRQIKRFWNGEIEEIVHPGVAENRGYDDSCVEIG